MREIIKETKNEIDKYIKEQNSQDIRLQRAQNNLAFLLLFLNNDIIDFFIFFSENSIVLMLLFLLILPFCLLPILITCL